MSIKSNFVEKIYYYFDILKMNNSRIFIENIDVDDVKIKITYRFGRIPVNNEADIERFYEECFIYLSTRDKCIIYKLKSLSNVLKKLIKENELAVSEYKKIIQEEIKSECF